MNNLTLVVLAAGMGSRYGGLKQLDPVGPNGEILIDYSLYDAAQAGFDKVVFIIRDSMLDAFRDGIGKRAAKFMNVDYVIQDSHKLLPDWFQYPEERNGKPWGTAHAILCCKNAVNTPFVVINADDFYGRESFVKLAEFLKTPASDGKTHFAMAGYILKNTLSPNGTVTRGVCNVDESGLLSDIEERMKICMQDSKVIYTTHDGTVASMDQNSVVSLNIWGFTPDIFDMTEQYRDDFFKNISNIEKDEFLLPEVVDKIIKSGKADVKVIPTHSTWYGVTYREDRPAVSSVLNQFYNDGVYPDLTK